MGGQPPAQQQERPARKKQPLEEAIEALTAMVSEDVALRREERSDRRTFDEPKEWVRHPQTGRAVPKERLLHERPDWQIEMSVTDIDDHAAGTWLWMFRRFPQMMDALDRVPPAFWTAETPPDTDSLVASVKCPCGREPLVELHHAVECECVRTFLFLAPNRMYVAGSPKKARERPARWEEIAAAHRADRASP